METKLYFWHMSLNGLQDSERHMSMGKVIQGVDSCQLLEIHRQLWKLWNGHQRFSYDSRIDVEQLHINWEMIYQICHENFWKM